METTNMTIADKTVQAFIANDPTMLERLTEGFFNGEFDDYDPELQDAIYRAISRGA